MEEPSVITSKTANQVSFLLVEPVGNSVTHPTAKTWQNLVTKVGKSLWSLRTFNLGMSSSDKTATATIVYKPAVASVFVTIKPCSWLRAFFS